MALAAGVRVNQVILADPYQSSDWDTDNSIVCNAQLLNAAVFEQHTGFAPPPIPITAEQYADEGIPFYNVYQEPSGISGKFKGLKSVAQMEIDKGRSKRARQHGEEKTLKFPTLDISGCFRMSSFVPVGEMLRKLEMVRVAQDL